MPKSAKKKKKENYNKYFFHYLYCLIVIAFLFVAGVNINNFINNQKVLGASIDVTPLQDEKKYWLKVISNNPTYIDAYLQVAKVNVELGDREGALNFLQRAQNLNPNSSKVEEVKTMLNL